MLRTSLLPGPAEGASPTTPPTATRAWPVRDRPRVRRPAGRRSCCPTSASMLAVVLAGARGAGRRCDAWRVAGRGARRRPASTRRGTSRCPACTPPARPAASPRRRGRRRRGRDRPGGARRLRHRRSASAGSRSTSMPLARAAHGDRPLPAGQPVPVQRHRPGLRGRRRRPGRRRRGARCGRRPASCWSSCACSTCTGASRREGRRSLAYALRLQAPDRTLTDDEVAEAAPALHRGGRVAPPTADRCGAEQSVFA